MLEQHTTVIARVRELAPDLFRCRGAVAPERARAVLQASLAKIDPARRDEVLRKAQSGGFVELELELLAYEQARGARNRNCVRFAERSIVALGATGIGKPFLRDHEQDNVFATLGFVVASVGTVADGHAEIRQTVKLRSPEAIDLLLRGLLQGVSIGWVPTGPVRCTVCDAPALTKKECRRAMHLPGDDVGDQVVEWEYTAAELVETSAVSVPAVPGARIESIRESVARVLSAGPRAPVPVAAAPAPPRRMTDGDMWARMVRAARSSR